MLNTSLGESMRPARPLSRIECPAVTGHLPVGWFSPSRVSVCPLSVALAPLWPLERGTRRPDCLIGRELRIAITSRKRVFFRRESGVVCLEHPLRTPRATSKVTHHYSSSHSFLRRNCGSRPVRAQQQWRFLLLVARLRKLAIRRRLHALHLHGQLFADRAAEYIYTTLGCGNVKTQRPSTRYVRARLEARQLQSRESRTPTSLSQPDSGRDLGCIAPENSPESPCSVRPHTTALTVMEVCAPPHAAVDTRLSRS